MGAMSVAPRLLVFDVEGTLFRPIRLPGTSIGSSMWQAIATALGPEAVREEIATPYRNYLDWMEATVKIHRKHNLTAAIFEELVSGTEYNEGVKETFAVLDREAFIPALVSGGFRELAAKAQRDLSIRHALAACEYLFDDDGALQGFNLLPCDFEGKIDFIKLMLRELRCDADRWIFVGDDKNDVPIAKIAPVSIAFRGVPELRAIATRKIDNFSELLSILPSS